MRTISLERWRSTGRRDKYRSREQRREVIEDTILDPRGGGDW